MNQPFIMKYKEQTVGAFVLIAGAIFFALIVVTLMRKEIFEEYYDLRTTFSMGIGLNPGAPVCLAGFSIGTIEAVELNEQGKISIAMRVKKAYQERIRSNSIARVQRLNPAVGDKFINISPGTAGYPVLESGSILRSTDPVELEDALAHLTAIAADMEKVIARIEDGQGTVGALLKDRATLDSLNTLLVAGYKILKNGDKLVRALHHTNNEVKVLVERLPGLTDNVSDAVRKTNHLVVKADTLLQLITSMVESSQPILTEGYDRMADVADIMHSVKRNWLIRRKLPKEDIDCLIYEETRR